MVAPQKSKVSTFVDLPSAKAAEGTNPPKVTAVATPTPKASRLESGDAAEREVDAVKGDEDDEDVLIC
jgi:hypothetical protein